MADETITTGWPTTEPVTQEELVQKVMNLYGIASDTDLEAKALEFLDDCVKDMNSHLYEFNKVTDIGIALVENQEYAELHVEFYREYFAYIVNTATGTRSEPLVYLPWASFMRLKTSGGDIATASGAAIVYYSIRNWHATGTVFLYPKPNAVAASDTTLTVEYFRRIPLISSTAVDASINVPQEVEVALVYGSQKRMAMHINGPGHPDVAALNALEEVALNRLKAIDQRHPDEKLRFRLVDKAQTRTVVSGRLYVELN